MEDWVIYSGEISFVSSHSICEECFLFVFGGFCFFLHVFGLLQGQVQVIFCEHLEILSTWVRTLHSLLDCEPSWGALHD